MESYAKFCKPQLTRALISLGLNRTYHRAAGNFLYYNDENGKEIPVLDLLGGYGATLLGHNSPIIREKIKQYLDEEIPIHNQFSIRNPAAMLAERLNELLKEETATRDDFIFCFASTGAESMEIALKSAEFTRNAQLLALEQEIAAATAKIGKEMVLTDEQCEQLQLEKSASIEEIKQALTAFNQTRLNTKPTFLALEHAFHGKMMVTANCTHGVMYRHYLKRLAINTLFLSADNLAEFAEMGEKANDILNSWLWLPQEENGQCILTKKPFRTVTALMIEPIQGEGGVHPLSAEQVRNINRLKQIVGCPVIADEVQAGSGRCGFLVASSDAGIQADYFVLSKALGGGYVKIGVVAIRQENFTPGFDIIQSSTFGEDDFSCRVALDYINLLYAEQRKLLKQVTQLGEEFKTRLHALQGSYPDVIRDIRGKGLIWGIEFHDVIHSDSYILQNIAIQGSLGYVLSGHLLCGSQIRVAPSGSAANVIRVEPSVFLELPQIIRFVEALSNACLAIRYANAGFIVAPMLGRRDQTRPADYRRQEQYLKNDEVVDYKAAFINHLISASGLREVDPSFSLFSDEELELFVENTTFNLATKPFKAARIRSGNGKWVEFTLYPLTVTSKMIKAALANNDLGRLRHEIDLRVTQAVADGHSVVGLGMFTSIITNNGKSIKNNAISVTTGNAFTVGIGIEALQSRLPSQNMATMRLAVVGGAGNIGRVYAEILAPQFQDVVLIGSSNHGSLKKLNNVKFHIYQNIYEQFIVNKQPVVGGLAQRLLNCLSAIPVDALCGKPDVGEAIDHYLTQYYPDQTFIHTSQDMADIENCDVIVCAANASEAFISVEKIKQRAIVCDISVPHNLSDADLQRRPDINMLRGGIVQTPHNDSLDPRVRAYLKEGQIYACMAETILLALAQYKGNFSYGNITTDQVLHIMAIAKKHNFTLSDIKENSSL
ncbi:putative Pyridoxalphosphate-dependent aminotransferase class III-like protein [Xenorhabdus poinarii G6]|uniref:Putative Pyridoxalphosphate-dependent aminotransferase class III-like protein n=1 Tax=Xenorhabdus poinarii G6 TaxID=1354304 RepID=A0A068R7U5_9GAMM|nr:aminotransferase class III-fold pyridoxal phosphate-dependent enzyme [Xenorhabdus poinarii]CDG23332.1 putative Pyridoxalphosphate-dependent aminotransferase class III-like protein [Xenorhabdus poinarii G6]